jgi:hypothetical protein
MHASMYLENKENKYNPEGESKEGVLVVTSRWGPEAEPISDIYKER